MSDLTMNITRENGIEIEVELEGSYLPEERGSYEDGLQMTPSYPASFEDIKATVVEDVFPDRDDVATDADAAKPAYTKGRVITLTRDEEQKAIKLLLEERGYDID